MVVGGIMWVCAKDGNLPGRAKDATCRRVVRELICRVGGRCICPPADMSGG